MLKKIAMRACPTINGPSSRLTNLINIIRIAMYRILIPNREISREDLVLRIRFLNGEEHIAMHNSRYPKENLYIGTNFFQTNPHTFYLKFHRFQEQRKYRETIKKRTKQRTNSRSLSHCKLSR